jgi:hypothetical protein
MKLLKRYGYGWAWKDIIMKSLSSRIGITKIDLTRGLKLVDFEPVKVVIIELEEFKQLGRDKKCQ